VGKRGLILIVLKTGGCVDDLRVS